MESSLTSHHDVGVLDQWSARKMQPRVLVYVAGVFAAFMAASQFLFHSSTGVKALGAAAAGAMVQLILGVNSKVEYRLTDSGLAKRPLKDKKPAPFKDVFAWDELSHLVPMKHGFKYFKTSDESNPFRRFWKTHLSDEYSGEVHLEEKDRDRILEILARRGVPMSRSAARRSLEGVGSLEGPPRGAGPTEG